MSSIDDKQIEDVEKIVRDDFSEMLQEGESNVLDYIEKDAIFGLYAANHQRFRFLPGEKSLIHQLVLHVSSLKPTDGGILQNDHFSMPQKFKLTKKDLCWTPIGYLYGNKSLTAIIGTAVNPDNHNSIDTSSKEDVLSKLNTLLAPYEETTSDEMIAIKNDGRKVWAEVTCVLCVQKNIDRKPLRVQYDVSKRTLKAYWNSSNFYKHLVNMHTEEKQKEEVKKKRERKVKNQLDELSETGLKDETEPKTKKSKKQIKVEALAAKSNETDVFDENNIPREGVDHFVFSIYNCIAGQNLKLTTANKTYSEDTNTMEFMLGTTRTVDVIKIAQDGNCLFSAAAHQIFLHKVDSPQHESAAKDLRKRVVDHIIANFASFRKDIERRLIYTDGTKAKLSENEMEKECRFFVAAILSKSGSWGGTESLKAISQVEKVNIIIFAESDDCYFPFVFDFEYKRTISVAFRLNKNQERDHYDSVAEVGRHTMYPIANALAKREVKREENKQNSEKVFNVSDNTFDSFSCPLNISQQ